MEIEIREQDVDGDKGSFLNVVDAIYAGDIHYIRPLDLDLSRRVSRANPFFEHAEGAILTARAGGAGYPALIGGGYAGRSLA